MARKSRKHLVDIGNKKNDSITLNYKEEKVFKTAIYTRLSVENSGKSEDKDVIKNQIEYCKDYINDMIDLKLVDIYIDDGYTGTNFNRPEFNRLMEDVRQNRIDAIVIRDLSRWARDYIETGIYIETILPSLNVRLISINENYDSFSKNKSDESLMIPLQNIINDFYSKDISRKVSTAIRTEIEEGTFKNRNLPYGYMWNNEHTQIIVDEEVRDNVKLIFKLKLEDTSEFLIAKKLNELNIPNPTYRKNENGVQKVKNCSIKNWSANTVNSILKNEIYTGDNILGKTYIAKYKGINKSIKTKDGDRIKIKNTHKEIISKKDFYKVQELLNTASVNMKEKLNKSEKMRSKFINFFDGKIYCGDCGKKMYYTRKKLSGYADDYPEDKIWTAYYNCSSHIAKWNDTCSAHFIREKKLHSIVLKNIKLQINVALDYEKTILKLKNSHAEKNVQKKQIQAISTLKVRIDDLNKKRARLYEDFIERVLNEEEYRFTKIRLNEEFNHLNGMLEEMIIRQNSFENAMSSENKWITLMKSTRKTNNLTQQIVDNVIQEIKIYDNNKIEIVMKYDDIYQLMLQGIDEILEEENNA